jgi:GNAT superfamily N-acetyltransferase
MPGPDGYRVRLARPGDGLAIAALMRLADVHAELTLLEAIESGLSGDIARRTIGGGADHAAVLASHLFPGGPGPDLRRALTASTAVLVATRRVHEEPIGMCHTTPPGAMMARIADAGAPVEAMYAMLMGVRKLASIAVNPDYRRAGVATALLQLATRLVFQGGAQMFYGQLRIDDGLADWYRDAGFTVLPPGEGLSVARLVDMNAAVRPGLGEQLFAAMASHIPVPFATPPGIGPDGEPAAELR